MNEDYKEIDIQGVIDRLHLPVERINGLIASSLNGDMLLNTEQAFASGNLEDAQRAVHTIKGTAATVGLVGLSKLALEMETKIKEAGYLDFELLEVLKAVWSELKSEIGNE